MFDTLDEIRRQLEALEDARAEFKEVVLGTHGVRSPNTEDMAGEMGRVRECRGWSDLFRVWTMTALCVAFRRTVRP